MVVNEARIGQAAAADLIRKANEMREYSYCPYSGFSVGAAILADDGRIYGGCNVENAAYSVGICAERTAIVKAISEGARHFRAIAVVGGKHHVPNEYSFPCGECRQVRREFCHPDEFEIIAAKSEIDYRCYTLEELLPESFSPENLV